MAWESLLLSELLIPKQYWNLKNNVNCMQSLLVTTKAVLDHL